MAESKAANNTTVTVAGQEIITKRVLSAPRELVFQVWTESKHVAQWWGPTGFTITTREMDVRPGGIWRYVMHGPDGTDYPNKIVYLEVERPERLVYAHGDDEGEHFRVTVTFAEQGEETEVTMRSLFKSVEELEYVVKEYGAAEGAKQTFDRLAEHIAKQ